MTTSNSYWDSCPECDSLDLKIEEDRNEEEDSFIWIYCRECGADWKEEEGAFT